ncbi:22530_t:CDS:2, partial [Rhizophagus irregularis]
ANHQRSESAIKAEQAAKEVLIICERNQTTLVEINEQVLRKTLQDSWWQADGQSESKMVFEHLNDPIGPLENSKTYMEFIMEKVFPKGSPSNYSAAFTIAI